MRVLIDGWMDGWMDVVVDCSTHSSRISFVDCCSSEDSIVR